MKLAFLTTIIGNLYLGTTLKTSIVSAYSSTIINNKSNEIDTKRQAIIGGFNVTSGNQQYPWYTRISITNEDKMEFCGGSLITPEYILTAARCVFNASSLSITIGLVCLDGFDCGQNVNIIRPLTNGTIEKVNVHDDYDLFTGNNDLALIRVPDVTDADLEANNETRIAPVDIDTGNVAEMYVNGEKNLWAMGFGITNETDLSYTPSILQHADLKYMTNDKCQEKVGYWVHPNMLCASDEFEMDGETIVQMISASDDGGPMYDANADMVVAVASKSENGTSMFTKTGGDNFVWIQDSICNDHTHYPPFPDLCDVYITKKKRSVKSRKGSKKSGKGHKKGKSKKKVGAMQTQSQDPTPYKASKNIAWIVPTSSFGGVLAGALVATLTIFAVTRRHHRDDEERSSSSSDQDGIPTVSFVNKGSDFSSPSEMVDDSLSVKPFTDVEVLYHE